MGFDLLQQFSWVAYCGVAALYSAVVFRGGRFRVIDAGVSIEHPRYPLIKLAAIHFVFLVLLLAMMGAACESYPHLPKWLIATFQGRGVKSVLDVVFILSLIAMQFLERRVLYSTNRENEPKKIT